MTSVPRKNNKNILFGKFLLNELFNVHINQWKYFRTTYLSLIWMRDKQLLQGYSALSHLFFVFTYIRTFKYVYLLM
jgi:hypothetical protein